MSFSSIISTGKGSIASALFSRCVALFIANKERRSRGWNREGEIDVDKHLQNGTKYSRNEASYQHGFASLRHDSGRYFR